MVRARPPLARWRSVLVGFILVATIVTRAHAAGAIAYKSGPIQITADGQFVWAVNPDFDSVSRLRTSDHQVTLFALPGIGSSLSPQALSITPNGSEVWVVAEDSDQVIALDAVTGAVIAVIDMPYGSGPVAAAISPDGSTALIALYRSASVAQCDVAGHSIVKIIKGLYDQPFAVTFVSVANRAWVGHHQIDGEHSFMTVIDTAARNVAAEMILVSTNPKFLGQIPPSAQDPSPIPEGGYVQLRSHMAQRPNTNQIFVPLQYANFHTDVFTPDSSIQSAVHRMNISNMTLVQDDRVVLSAVTAHNNANQFLGPGWNAGVSGPRDIAFSADGQTAYVAHTYSNDVIVLPAAATQQKPTGANPLTEIPVGVHPIGLAASPIAERLYVLNELSRDLSILDLVSLTEIARVPMTTGLVEPRSPTFLAGAKLFNASTDPRASGNQKIACASCHPNEETDSLSWDFAQLGAGTRKTLPLRGLNLSFGPQANGRGQLHRSGDRDEVQDFDLTFRGTIMGGTGFIGSVQPALGAPNAGLDADLDAMADYLLSLPPVMRSPTRTSDGSLSDAAKRGAAIYGNQSGGPLNIGCNVCHPAPFFTDKAFHDVGGLAPAIEHEGPFFNTPSLISAWAEPPFRQAIGATSATGQTGFFMGDILRDSADGTHGDTGGLNKSQMRDVEEFLNSIDGNMADEGIVDLVDIAPPRIIAVLPVSLGAVEVLFDETVDPQTAGNPAKYRLTDGHLDIQPVSAVVNATYGNRVRLAATLPYPGCPISYTLIPGPIEDIAGTITPGAANNVLDMNDPANRLGFEIDGSITVTFGDVGDETFPSVARDASFSVGQPTVSQTHIKLSPAGSIEQKGFVAFDFVSTLANECGIDNAADILDARFAGRPDFGHRNTVELHRCLMPWGDPPRDFCNACAGAVTQTHATYNTIPWHQNSARAIGGAGSTLAEYYPTGGFDIAASIDASVAIAGINEPLEFSGPFVTDAFRFWFTNPTKNFGYCMEIAGNINNTGVEFWAGEADDGRRGFTLAITFAVSPDNGFQDCNANGVYDGCDPESTDMALFIAQLIAPSQDPTLVCMLDQNGDHQLNGEDMEPFVIRAIHP